MRCFKMNYRIQDKRDLFWCCFSSCGSSSFPASEQWEAGIAVFQAHVKRTLLLPASECGPPISSLSTKNMRQLSPSLASYRWYRATAAAGVQMQRGEKIRQKMLWPVTLKQSASKALAYVMLTRHCTEPGGSMDLLSTVLQCSRAWTDLCKLSVIILQGANRNVNCKAREACQTGWLNTGVKLHACYRQITFLSFPTEKLMFTECLN